MEQKDYILREIERIGFLLARLRDRILGRSTSAAAVKRDLHSAAGSLGVDLEIAHQVTPETLLMLVTGGGSVDPTRCWFFAESLYLEGLESQLSGAREEAEDLLVRSRMLFQLLEDRKYRLVHVTEASERLAEIDSLLGAGPTP